MQWTKSCSSTCFSFILSWLCHLEWLRQTNSGKVWMNINSAAICTYNIYNTKQLHNKYYRISCILFNVWLSSTTVDLSTQHKFQLHLHTCCNVTPHPHQQSVCLSHSLSPSLSLSLSHTHTSARVLARTHACTFKLTTCTQNQPR